MGENNPTLKHILEVLSVSLESQARQLILYDRSMNKIVSYDSFSEVEDKYNNEEIKLIDYSPENPIIEIQLIKYKEK